MDSHELEAIKEKIVHNDCISRDLQKISSSGLLIPIFACMQALILIKMVLTKVYLILK